MSRFCRKPISFFAARRRPNSTGARASSVLAGYTPSAACRSAGASHPAAGSVPLPRHCIGGWCSLRLALRRLLVGWLWSCGEPAFAPEAGCACAVAGWSPEFAGITGPAARIRPLGVLTNCMRGCSTSPGSNTCAPSQSVFSGGNSSGKIPPLLVEPTRAVKCPPFST